MTHVYTCISQGLFKNKVFRSVALVIKKLRAILDSLQTGLFSALYSTTKNSLNYYSFNVTKFHGVSVKNARTKKNYEGGGRQMPACLGLTFDPKYVAFIALECKDYVLSF